LQQSGPVKKGTKQNQKYCVALEVAGKNKGWYQSVAWWIGKTKDLYNMQNNLKNGLTHYQGMIKFPWIYVGRIVGRQRA